MAGHTFCIYMLNNKKIVSKHKSTFLNHFNHKLHIILSKQTQKH